MLRWIWLLQIWLEQVRFSIWTLCYLLSKHSLSSQQLVEFGNLESPMHARLRYFFSTIYSRCSLLSMQKLCYIAADYDAELRKNTKGSCEVAGEGWFTLSNERFQTGEILFQPHIGGV
ncbi:hypothetical protein BHE74_00001239 [Ensete ventricosum]|nr:hypothetical protein GW17_00016945 [Ensete ventricosum]RWW89721.1 hypothetical protein BHE74_00001239 [Ensete ventricosum]RZR79403.1 hypothetical protein BHM03_00005120 [Ensete ventricosum]